MRLIYWGLVNAREPLNKYMVPLRDLKRAASRRVSPLMVIVLSKRRNDEDVRFRPRPSGQSACPDLFVVSFRQADAWFQRDASTSEQAECQRHYILTQRLPRMREGLS